MVGIRVTVQNAEEKENNIVWLLSQRGVKVKKDLTP